MVFIFSGMVLIFRCKSLYTQLISLGLVGLFAFASMINIGVTIGALPTKGLSLPFISYGGSSLIANMIALGLLWNVSNLALDKEFSLEEEP